jgi:D-inositol-3-phosphate glycosyltransferase
MINGMEVALLTGGYDKPYVSGLTGALASQDVWLDVVGGDEIDGPEMYAGHRLNFLNLRRSKGKAGGLSKILRITAYYARLLRYAAIAKPRIFHILWNNRFESFDRTFLMLYYKALGKKIVFTAHNVNAGKRDANDSLLNRLTLKTQYWLSDHIFVHTERMKSELVRDFKVREEMVTVIPFGINNSVPSTEITCSEARRRLGIQDGDKVILFFGALRPYKGLEYLTDGFLRLAARHPEYRLIIAGQPRKDAEKYLDDILHKINADSNRASVLLKLEYIPDDQTEWYFKAADVLALPYTHVFQSGVLFLAYSFGLPVVASDIASVREEVIEGNTGFICKSCDSLDLARAVEAYFASDLFRELAQRRHRIREWANARNSWSVVGETTCKVYSELVAQ